MTGTSREGVGFSPILREPDSKKETTSRNGSFENPWALKMEQIWRSGSWWVCCWQAGLECCPQSKYHSDVSSRWRPQRPGEWVRRRAMAPPSVEGAAPESGQGEGQAPLLCSEGRESHYGLSLPL